MSGDPGSVSLNGFPVTEMLIHTLFFLVFLSQTLTLSLYYPRVVARELAGAPSHGSETAHDRHSTQGGLVLYSVVNAVMVAVGLTLLTLFFTVAVFDSLKAMLLAVGSFFFLQLSPLALIAGRFNSPGDGEPVRASRRTIQLSDVVSPPSVVAAGTLLLVYGATQVIRSGGAWGTELLKVSILLGANMLFAAILVGNLRRIQDETGEAQAKRLDELRKSAPVLVYVSIGLTIYFFGKDVIFSSGVDRLRPIMMSVFLQALGVLTYSKLRPSRGEG